MARRRAREERGHRASRVNRELITRTIERDRVEPLSRIVFGELTALKAVPVAVLEVQQGAILMFRVSAGTMRKISPAMFDHSGCILRRHASIVVNVSFGDVHNSITEGEGEVDEISTGRVQSRVRGRKQQRKTFWSSRKGGLTRDVAGYEEVVERRGAESVTEAEDVSATMLEPETPVYGYGRAETQVREGRRLPTRSHGRAEAQVRAGWCHRGVGYQLVTGPPQTTSTRQP